MSKDLGINFQPSRFSGTYILGDASPGTHCREEGLKIELIVRGMCSLWPGVPGENIMVKSIVGRFLEHSRIFYFANGGDEQVYLGSADWMPRNLYERVEVLFPVRDPGMKFRLRYEILEAYLADNAKARLLRSDGSYVRAWQISSGRRKPPSRLFNAQQFLIDVAEGKADASSIPILRPSKKNKVVAIHA